MSWVADPLAERRAERERLIGLAQAYAEELSRRLPLVGAAVAGSVARGDFNVWSDVDVVVVSDALPGDPLERAAVLASPRSGGVEPHGYTTAEFEHALRRRDRLACEALSGGVALHGRLPG